MTRRHILCWLRHRWGAWSDNLFGLTPADIIEMGWEQRQDRACSRCWTVQTRVRPYYEQATTKPPARHVWIAAAVVTTAALLCIAGLGTAANSLLT